MPLPSIRYDLEMCARFQKAMHEAQSVSERIEQSGHLQTVLNSLRSRIADHQRLLPMRDHKQKFQEQMDFIASLALQCASYQRNLRKDSKTPLPPPNIDFDRLRIQLAEIY